MSRHGFVYDDEGRRRAEVLGWEDGFPVLRSEAAPAWWDFEAPEPPMTGADVRELESELERMEADRLAWMETRPDLMKPEEQPVVTHVGPSYRPFEPDDEDDGGESEMEQLEELAGAIGELVVSDGVRIEALQRSLAALELCGVRHEAALKSVGHALDELRGLRSEMFAEQAGLSDRMDALNAILVRVADALARKLDALEKRLARVEDPRHGTAELG